MPKLYVHCRNHRNIDDDHPFNKSENAGIATDGITIIIVPTFQSYSYVCLSLTKGQQKDLTYT